MRRVFAIVSCWIGLVSAAVAQDAVSRGPATASVPAAVTRPTTEPAATQPTTASATTEPATQPTTQAEADQAAADAKAEADRQAAVARDAAARLERQKLDEERAERLSKLTEARNRLATNAEEAAKDLASLTAALEQLAIAPGEIDSALQSRQPEIEARVAENTGLLAGAPTLETLAQQREMLDDDLKQLDDWANELKERWNTLRVNRDKLKEQQLFWEARRDELSNQIQTASTRPGVRSSTRPATRASATDLAPLFARCDTVLRQNAELTQQYRELRGRIDQLQLAITNTRLKASDAFAAVSRAQQLARDRLLKQDSPPLWNALLHPMAQGDVTEQGRNTINSQWHALANYVPRQIKAFLLHAGGVAALVATLIWLRRRTRQWTAGDPMLLAATRVFQTPIATALTASMILTPWIYLAAPRLFWGLLGTAALAPTLMVLRPLIERSLRPLLYGLAVAIFVNLILSVVASLPAVYRALQLGQMGGATVFFLWFLRTRRGVADDPNRPPLRKAVIVGARIGLCITIAAALANVFGYVSLARLIGNALLTSAYLGVLLDTSIHVIDALLLGLSHVQPISGLGMVQRHRPLVLRRLHLLLIVLAVGVWGFFTLESLSIRQPVFDRALAVWNFPRNNDVAVSKPTPDSNTASTATPDKTAGKSDDSKITTNLTLNGFGSGPINVSGTITVPGGAKAATPPADTPATGNEPSSLLTVGGVILFVLSIVCAIYTARFITFLLDEDIYPRLNLARGMPYAITTLLRYVILAVGFSLAIVNLGYGDPTKLTILVSAFSIGLGFGLQNIVNNFVSGLILLFERPVQVGDVIEMDNVTGVVSRIGIRASVIRTPLAAEIIVPNGRLISDRVVNWTLSNRQRGVEMSIVVVAGAIEPQKLIQLLVTTAKSLPLVAAYPAPQAYFTDFSGGGLKFEVRAWTNRFEDWVLVRSELAVAVNAMLLKENVPLK